MRVRNIHQREIAAPASSVGALIDGLSSSQDALWPHQYWPRMKFDRPLGVGAVGGHGPVRYTVEAYESGRSVLFRFTGPPGFNGTHGCVIEPVDAERTILRHEVAMQTGWPATVGWPLVFGPLHDALLEDALDCAERSVGTEPRPRSWSRWVRLLRWVLTRGRAPSRRGRRSTEFRDVAVPRGGEDE